MKLYKIRGTSEWVPWDVLYNERGYNSVPCIDMTFKSISPWGTNAGSGYKTDSAGDATYFVSGETGWKLAFNLPEDFGVYPDEATPIQMIKDGVISDAVWMEFFGSKWYLIQAEIANERYWIHELALPEYGWEIYEGKDYEFILVDGTTGRIVHGVEQLNEMVFAPTGYFTIEDTGDVVFVEQSPYPIVSRFHVDFDAVQTLADGAYIDTVLPYYTSKLYIAGIVNRVAETVVDFELTVSNEGGCVRVTNNTGASVTLTRLAIQSMDVTDAEVVEVVDGQDNHAYAFKWNDSGTPYWWISYSRERHWTDTLGNWSDVVLPEVDMLNTLGQDATSIASQGYSYNLKYWSSGGWYGNYEAYDSTKSYAAVEYGEEAGVWLNPCNIFVPVNRSGDIAVQNISSSSKTFRSVKIAVCSDSTATVVTVYNSSNVAYNAFLYRAGGTDYYYVLDGVQADWTDDLAGIGYSLTPTAQTAYLNTPNNTQSLPMVGDGIVYTYILFNESGNWLSTSNDYTLVGYHASVDGPLLSFEGTGVYLFKDTTYGRMKITSNGAMRVSIQRIEYTVS